MPVLIRMILLLAVATQAIVTVQALLHDRRPTAAIDGIEYDYCLCDGGGGDGDDSDPLPAPSFDRLLASSLASSDKTYHHGYHRFYSRLLEPYYRLRTSSPPIRLLEIGVQTGVSIEAWERLFPDGSIYAIDYDGRGSSLSSPNRGDQLYRLSPSGSSIIYYGDQSDGAFLQDLVQDLRDRYDSDDSPTPLLDVVIDDGSHVPTHQIFTFEQLWPHVAPGGLYLIEDIETSYWQQPVGLYGYSFDREPSALDHFKQAIEVVQREFSRFRDESRYPADVYHSIQGLSFYQNLIVIRKQDPAVDGPYSDRTYRFERWL